MALRFGVIVLTLVLLTATLKTSADNSPTRVLDFYRTPAAEAVNRLDHAVGMHIQLYPSIDATQPVTFTVDFQKTADVRLNAVHFLSHALNAHVEKLIVVDSASQLFDPAIDHPDLTIRFGRRTMPAWQAIKMIAGLDQAAVNFRTSPAGTIKFSAANLTLARAAYEAARQTHTRWNTIYQIVPDRMPPTPTDAVIGYTASGSPITAGPPDP